MEILAIPRRNAALAIVGARVLDVVSLAEYLIYGRVSGARPLGTNDRLMLDVHSALRPARGTAAEQDSNCSGNTGEFAIALPETDVEEARHVAERQLYRSKKLHIPSLEETGGQTVYITVIKSEPGDNSESIYLRAKKIIDDRIDDGIHPLFC